jgi:hypothetical protein
MFRRNRYRVAFDGEWQETFDDEGAAKRWASEIAGTGRMVWVSHRGRLNERLVAVYPEDQRELGEQLWDAGRGAGSYVDAPV